MRASFLANILARDVSPETTLGNLSAEILLAIVEAINGGIQRLDVLSPLISKQSPGAIFLSEPVTVELEVENGEDSISGTLFDADSIYKTIKIEGDGIDNQITATDGLLHPYMGTSGVKTATIYSDCAPMPETFSEIIGALRILETSCRIEPISACHSKKENGTPRFFHVEANSRNLNPPYQAVIRFDRLPTQNLRLVGNFITCPIKVSMPDLLTSDAVIPVRDDHAESYLIPMCRAVLARGLFWKNADTRTAAIAESDRVEAIYLRYVQEKFHNPINRVGTREGY